MKHNYSAIGERIRTLRKEKGWSQDVLIWMLKEDYGIAISRTTYSAIENGNMEHCELSLLEALCEVFKCGIAYILCEDECKTRDTQFIHDITGLSEKAIKSLNSISIQPIFGSEMNHFINAMLEDREFLVEAGSNLARIREIPQKAFVQIAFIDENDNDCVLKVLEPTDKNGDDVTIKPLLLSPHSESLRNLFIANLQNIIFEFITRDIKK